MAWNPNIPTVTNRIQDDLDAIRENFQVLDGHLADTNNPHQVTAAQVGAPTQAAFDAHVADTNNPHNVQAQQVPYSSGVAGFSPADVKAALDALAGVRIVEMGSNANGEYVRWENGLQVAWFRSGAVTVDVQTGALYAKSTTWTFPAAFVATPYVIPGAERAETGSGAAFCATYRPATNTAAYLTVYDAVSGRKAFAVAIAIGRWK